MSRNAIYVRMTDKKEVAPREGRVSRNYKAKGQFHDSPVAPREGRVSRNPPLAAPSERPKVAPREGRVSRNRRFTFKIASRNKSRPARGV